MKKGLIIGLAVLMVFALATMVMAGTLNDNFSGTNGEHTITTINSDVFDVFHVETTGDFEGHQHVNTSASTYIERWGTFNGPGEIDAYSFAEGPEAHLNLHAQGDEGWLDQMAPLHSYYHGCNFTGTYGSYNDFVVGATSSSPSFVVSAYAGFEDGDAEFWACIDGNGTGEIRGISLMAKDRYGYDWIYGGNNMQWQPISGSAGSSGNFELGAYGLDGLEFDFDWNLDGTGGNTYTNTNGESFTGEDGTYDTNWNFAGIVRAYAPK